MSVYNILLGIAGPFLFFNTVSSNQVDYNLYNQLIAGGWNGTSPAIVSLTIGTGVEITASNNSTAAFTTGTFPSGSSIYITNNGYIVGRGGQGVGKGSPTSTSYNLTAPATANGGVALSVSSAVYIDNTNGVVGGGGGAGGVGGGTSADCSCTSCGGVGIVGMTPSGGGAGYGAAGSGGTYWKNNTLYYQYVSSGAGTLTAAGAQGTGGSAGGTAGASGTLGVDGSSGGGSTRCGYTNQSGPGTGGTAGACTSGNANITWVATGNRYGALN